MEIVIRKKHQKLLRALLLTCMYVFMAFPISGSAHAGEPLLVIRTAGEEYEHAVNGIRQEVGDEFLISEMLIDRGTGREKVSDKMKAVSPKLVVLMDNISISLYKKYQDSLPAASQNPVPSISLMASFTDIAIKKLKNATGIFYEVPVVTSIVNLRTIMPEMPIRKVGVVYRTVMESSMHTNQAYCQQERVKLISYPISAKKDIASELKKGLAHLRGKIDALWVLNDSMLVNAQLIREIWHPFIRELKKPVIVGIEVLVQPRFQFGTFGVVPNHAELGIQAAEMIYNIMDDDWQVSNSEVEQPRSVYKILNLDQAEQLFGVGREQLSFVDKILR